MIGKGLGIESGWYFAVGISIPLVIWFIATHLKELKGESTKPNIRIKDAGTIVKDKYFKD